MEGIGREGGGRGEGEGGEGEGEEGGIRERERAEWRDDKASLCGSK